jgi:hypothetical protein
MKGETMYNQVTEVLLTEEGLLDDGDLAAIVGGGKARAVATAGAVVVSAAGNALYEGAKKVWGWLTD